MVKPAASNFLQQQAKFDDFIDCYNNERPHQVLTGRHRDPTKACPTSITHSTTKTVAVTTCARICFNQQKINLSLVFAGQNVGVKQVSDRIWLVTFMDYDLGYFDHETCRLEPLENPFGPKVLPMSPV
jgi:putative transposase